MEIMAAIVRIRCRQTGNDDVWVVEHTNGENTGSVELPYPGCSTLRMAGILAARGWVPVRWPDVWLFQSRNTGKHVETELKELIGRPKGLKPKDKPEA